MPKNTTRMAVVGAFFALGFGWQSVAQACTPVPPPCVELPPQGASFPANAVAFRLIDGRPPMNSPRPTPTPCIGDPSLCPVVPPPPTFEESFGLRTEDGGVSVPASVKTLPNGERVFSPDVPLEPDRRYLLRYDNGFCFDANPEDFSFLATEPIPFPPNAGTLEVIDQGVMDVGDGTRFAFVKLKLLETPESQPFLALRTYEVAIDGRTLKLEGRFTVGKARDIFIPSACPDSKPLVEPCGQMEAVKAGHHVVTVTPQILGAPAGFPALKKEIQISCDQMNSSNTLLPTPTTSSMAGTAPESTAACSFAAGNPASGSCTLVAGSVALALLHRRRRRVSRGAETLLG